MTADTLRSKLKDANAEVRRGRRLACALKEDAGLTGDLIAASTTRNPGWPVSAGVALRQLTGQDFGPHGRCDAGRAGEGRSRVEGVVAGETEK